MADLRIYYSNALDVLARLLADELARPAPDGDWLRPDVVLVPQFAMRRWLQHEIAAHAGVSANLRFLTPGEFVDEALDAHLGPAPAGDRLAPEVSRWHVLRALREAPPAALARYLDDAGTDTGDPLRAWSLAEALAGTFERYQAWRRDWLLDWERGRIRDGGWQAPLWARIARHRAHRARRLDAYLARFGAGGGDAPTALPPRLFVFACQNVSPDVLAAILSQSRAGVQHAYVHTPARAWWGDVRRYAADYTPASDDAFAGDNVLLASWGQAGRDFIAALASGEAGQATWEARAFAEPPAHTLLGRLQRGVLDNRPIAAVDDAERAAGWPRAAVDADDASLRFHACHTPLREVQVLHDQLRALLEAPGHGDDPPLEPRDIAVLAPDIDAYAPHIEAVFGGALGTPRELPYTIADTSPLATASLAAAFLRVLELPLHALSAAELDDLMAVPAIAARFGLDEAARARVRAWLQRAGARWALDAADRARHGAAHDEAFTVAFALERLLLGYAIGEDADIARVAAWPDLEGQDADALDALLRLVALLREAASTLGAAQPPAAWGERLDALLARLFAPERDGVDARVLARLREAVAAFARSAHDAGYDAPVAHAVVLDHLKRALGDVDVRAPFLSGGICFGRMVPMRLIPFRVICLLGMDEAAFPARDPHDPINLLAREVEGPRRRVGDPSLRDADRFLFLQLFASAGRAFHVSWSGMDPRDGHAKPPASPVSELLEAAIDAHRTEDAQARDALREALVVRHALQPYSAAAFGAPHADAGAGDPRRFSYDARWHAAAAPTSGRAPAPPFAVRVANDVAADEPTADVERLRRALNHPLRFWLHEGPRLRLPTEEDAPIAHEPLGAPSPLEAHGLRDAVFARWLEAGARPRCDALAAPLQARALLAPGDDGERTLREALDVVAPFAEAALAAGFGGAGATRPYAFDHAGVRWQGALDGVHGDRVLRVTLNPRGRHGRHALRHGLDRLLAAALGLEVVEFACDGERAPVSARTRMPDAEQALHALDALRRLRLRARREPLPFLPKSAYRAWRARRDGRDDGRALDDASKEWCGDDRDDGPRAEADASARLALRGRDPFDDRDAAARAAFLALADAVFGAVEDGAPFDADALPGALA